MNSYQLLQNEDCDIEIHNTQQEKKWLKKKRILEQKKETSANMERISQITIALNEYQERINPKPKVTKPKVTKPKVTKNDSNNFLEREFHNNKKYWENLPISYDADLSVKAKEERDREQRVRGGSQCAATAPGFASQLRTAYCCPPVPTAASLPPPEPPHGAKWTAAGRRGL